jgi:hypothetical protein
VPARRLVLPEDIATRPFTRAAGESRGLRTSSFRSAGVRRLAPGVFQGFAAGDPQLRDVVAAQLATLDEAVVADGLTALQLYGVDLGTFHPIRLCAPADRDVRRAGVRVRRVASVPPSSGRVLTPTAAWAAAAVELDLVELVVAGDWLVRLKRTTPKEIQAYAATLSGRHCRTVERAAALVRANVDSRPESRLRMCLVLAGLPEPICNLELGDEYFFIAQPDLTYLVYKLLLEYEGDHHRTDPVQWDRDIERTRLLAREGFIVERVTKQRLKRPRRLVAEIYDALVAGGYDGPPPVISSDWLAHFEPATSSGKVRGSSSR